MSFVIAIDGPAASGKGTLARRLAEYYKLPHLDTGLLYRATACALIDEGLSLENTPAAEEAARGLSLNEFDVDRLRSREIGEASSVVASIPSVRAALIEMQQNFAARPEGLCLMVGILALLFAPRPVLKYLSQPRPRRVHNAVL